MCFCSSRENKEVGYDGMLMPDHVPAIASDAARAQAFAYTFGYIKALIRTVDAETARAPQERLR